MEILKDQAIKLILNLYSEATNQIKDTKIDPKTAAFVVSGFLSSAIAWRQLKAFLSESMSKDPNMILDRSVDSMECARDDFNAHHQRRSRTYPGHISNTWYHICDSSELPTLSSGEGLSRVKQVRMLGQVFALWRTSDGKPICMDAFCIHLGANIAGHVDGTGAAIITRHNGVDCVECPFHKWKFAADGSVKDIPYISNSSGCYTTKKMKTYPTVDWCGLVCIFFSPPEAAEDDSRGSNIDETKSMDKKFVDPSVPSFPLPSFVENDMLRGKWKPHLKWNVGFRTLSPVDWVDQAGDYAHFHTLHSDLLIPWTLYPLPDWLLRLVPMGICHTLKTYRGDDKEWAERRAAALTLGPDGSAENEVIDSIWGQNLTAESFCVNSRYIYFTDNAGITWRGKPVTMSETLEVFIGPAIMCFNIPFTIGAFKAFVTTTPVDGGSIMRVRTWADARVMSSPWKRFICWILAGISASQLVCDIKILEEKIRLRKPLLQPFDGPYNRTNSWLRQFYSGEKHYWASNNGGSKYGVDW
eukprot:gene23117-31434_t